MSWKEHTQSNTKIQKQLKWKLKALIFFITFYNLNPLFGFVLFFLGVAYTQLFFEFLKLHFEPFKYGHAVNAQPEFPFSCGFLSTVAVECSVLNFSLCSFE